MRVEYFEWDDHFLETLRQQAGLLRLLNYLIVQEGGDAGPYYQRLLDGYDPRSAEDVSGVPAEEIERLA